MSRLPYSAPALRRLTLSLTFSARSDNAKTGDIPQAWVTGPRGLERAASMASCSATGCKLLGGGCYARRGTVATGFASHVKRGPVSIEDALAKRSPSARFVRFSALGDVSACVPDAVDAIAAVRSAGLGVVGYTHGWRDPSAAPLRGQLLASCETLTDVDAAVAAGWRASVVLPVGAGPTKTPAGHHVIVCPATRRNDVTCNRCGLCDGARRGPVIGFPAHGRQARKATALAS